MSHIYIGPELIPNLGYRPVCRCGWKGKLAWNARTAASKYAAHVGKANQTERRQAFLASFLEARARGGKQA